MSNNDQAPLADVTAIEIDELADDTGAGTFGTASTLGCPSTAGTFGCAG